MCMFHYNQDRWDYKVGFKSAHKSGDRKTFRYTYISNEGTFTCRWAPRLVFTDRYVAKYRFNNCKCDIGVNWFMYKRTGLRFMAQTFGESLMVLHTPYDIFPITVVTVNGILDINLILQFMQKNEAMFRI